MKPVVVRRDEATGRNPEPGRDQKAWSVLGWTALVFVVVGGFDLVATWVPARFGNAEWEFGTITGTLDNIPILTLGLALLLAKGIRLDQRWLVVSVTALFGIGAVVLVGAMLLYAMTVPVALGALEGSGIRLGLQKAIAKTILQGLAYPTLYGALAVVGFRSRRTSEEE